jgi:hypothetical protein
MVTDEIVRQLDEILDNYNKMVEEYRKNPPREDKEAVQQSLSKFEEIKVSIIKPAMEELGSFLEKKGQQYQIKDEMNTYGNPRLTMEIFPRTTASGYDYYETPIISFILDRISGGVGLQKKNGMPGRPSGPAITEAVRIDEITPEFVRAKIIELIKENFR